MTNESKARDRSKEATPQPDLTADTAGLAAFLSWVQALLTTSATLTGDEMTILDRIRVKINKVVPSNILVAWSFPMRGADRTMAKMTPTEVWYPSQTHKRGRLVSPALSLDEQRKMNPLDIPGPRTSTGETVILINPRTGAGLSAAVKRLNIAVAIVHGLILAAEGEPEADSKGRQNAYNNTTKADFDAVGFDTTEWRTAKYRPKEGLRHFLSNILDIVGDFPTAVIEAEPGYSATPTRSFKVVCPWDLRPERIEAAMSALSKGNGADAIKSGVIHLSFRAAPAFNIKEALPFCHRAHIEDPLAAKPKDVGYQQSVMLAKDNRTPVPVGVDPASVAGETVAEAVVVDEPLAATGTDGAAPAVAPVEATSRPKRGTGRKKST